MPKIIQIVLATVLMVPCSVAGILTSVSTPAALNPTDSADWGQLGPDLTIVTGPVSVTSLLGLSITLANGTEDFWSLQQGNSWGGNYNSGDNLVLNQAGGPVTLSFNLPVAGIGMRFQSLGFGAFTAFITAFGAGNTNFGTVSANGTSSNAGNGSALFLGVLSSSTDITSLVLNVQQSGLDDPFTMGTLQIAPTIAATPEPLSMMLVGAGLLCCAGRARKSIRK